MSEPIMSTGPTLFIGPATDLLQNTSGGKFLYESQEVGPVNFFNLALKKAIEINATIIGICDPNGKCKTSELLGRLMEGTECFKPFVPQLVIPHSTRFPAKKIEIVDRRQIMIAETSGNYFELSYAPRKNLGKDTWFIGIGLI